MKIDELADRIIDYRGKTPPKSSSGIPLITAKVIKAGRIRPPNEFITEATYGTWMRRGLPRQWDVLMTTEAPLGEVALLRTSEPVALAQRVILIRGRGETVDQRFLAYALQSPQVQARIRARATGTTVEGIKQSELRQVDVPLPSLEEQKKIAAVLAAYDELIENNLRRIEILEEMAQAIYREWFVNFRYPGHESVPLVDSPLGPIPLGWEVATVGDAFEVLGGATPSTKKPEYWDGGDINWFTPSDLTGHGHMVIKESGRKITQAGLDGCSARLFAPGAVMMTSRATLGVTAINAEPACTNQGFITCLPNSHVSAEQIYFWIAENLDRIISLASGATFKEISKRVFKTIGFLIAPRTVTDSFDEAVKPMIGLTETLISTNSNLRATRDLLLPKLISGEIDVSDLDIDTSWLAA